MTDIEFDLEARLLKRDRELDIAERSEKAAIKAKYKEDLNEVDDVSELILDELVKIDKISDSDKKFLERFKSLSFISLNHLGLTTVQNMPMIPTLKMVSFLDQPL